jgi:hypothetical protein
MNLKEHRYKYTAKWQNRPNVSDECGFSISLKPTGSLSKNWERLKELLYRHLHGVVSFCSLTLTVSKPSTRIFLL